jgi:hypothetical protein
MDNDGGGAPEDGVTGTLSARGDKVAVGLPRVLALMLVEAVAAVLALLVLGTGSGEPEGVHKAGADKGSEADTLPVEDGEVEVELEAELVSEGLGDADIVSLAPAGTTVPAGQKNPSGHLSVHAGDERPGEDPYEPAGHRTQMLLFS